MATAPNVLGEPPVATPAPPSPDPQVQQQLTQQSSDIARLKTLAAELAAKAATPPPAQRPADPAQPLTKAQLEKQFYEDPLGMMDAMALRRAQEVSQANGAAGYETQVEQAKMLARADDPVLFDRFRAEVEEAVSKNIHPLQHQNVNIWRTAFKVIKGEHIGEIVEAARKAAAATPAPTTDGPAPAGNAVPRANGKDVKLNDEEKFVAEKLGITHDEYTQGKALIENIVPGHYETAPTAFDEYMTFDSKTQRRAKRAAAKK